MPNTSPVDLESTSTCRPCVLDHTGRQDTRPNSSRTSYLVGYYFGNVLEMCPNLSHGHRISLLWSIVLVRWTLKSPTESLLLKRWLPIPSDSTCLRQHPSTVPAQMIVSQYCFAKNTPYQQSFVLHFPWCRPDRRLRPEKRHYLIQIQGTLHHFQGPLADYNPLHAQLYFLETGEAPSDVRSDTDQCKKEEPGKLWNDWIIFSAAQTLLPAPLLCARHPWAEFQLCLFKAQSSHRTGT